MIGGYVGGLHRLTNVGLWLWRGQIGGDQHLLYHFHLFRQAFISRVLEHLRGSLRTHDVFDYNCAAWNLLTIDLTLLRSWVSISYHTRRDTIIESILDKLEPFSL